MKSFRILLFLITYISTSSAQNMISENDIIGTWSGKVTQSKSKGTKMMLDGSTITIKADHTFKTDIMRGFTGTWKLEQKSIILDSPDTPDPIILSEVTKDSCIWKFEAMKATISYHKSTTKEEKETSIAPSLVQVKRQDLIGKWENILPFGKR